MDALLTLFALALQPRVALGYAVSIGAAVAFAQLVPGASGLQAIMLGCIGIAASAVLAHERTAQSNASQPATPSSVLALGGLFVGAVWGAASHGSSSSLLVGFLVQGSATWLWVRNSKSLAPSAPQGAPLLAAALAQAGFLLGLGIAAVAA